ncbi:periplasmic nitrate reductase, NapE protein [Neisseriaceae bacterium B1]
MNDKTIKPELPSKQEWKQFLMLACIILPVLTLLVICAYGFLVWFGQILWWGPPK